MGGGILPVAFYKGKIYFLFSREQINSTVDSGLWSDFGGASEKGESFFQAASREAHEESSGFLGSLKNIENIIENKTLFTIDNLLPFGQKANSANCVIACNGSKIVSNLSFRLSLHKDKYILERTSILVYIYTAISI